MNLFNFAIIYSSECCKCSLIRPNCAQNLLRSDWCALEPAFDQTEPARRKWPLIRSLSSRSDLWSYYFALEPNPRPCNFGLGTLDLGLITDHFRLVPQPGKCFIRLPRSSFADSSQSNHRQVNLSFLTKYFYWSTHGHSRPLNLTQSFHPNIVWLRKF